MKNEIKQNDVNLFQTERKGNSDFVIIEGLHAFKHATRFHAEFDKIYICNREITLQRAKKFLKPLEYEFLCKKSKIISEEDFRKIAPNALRTGIVGRAKKPTQKYTSTDKNRFVVALENPKDLNNIGAVIRACAAKGTVAVVIIGESNPWHANTLRGSAGLHFAQTIISLSDSKELRNTFPNREIIAVSDEGDNVYDSEINPNSILIFGTERDGIKKTTKELADKIIGLPMQEGVSSMNLATAVSAFLYAKK